MAQISGIRHQSVVTVRPHFLLVKLGELQNQKVSILDGVWIRPVLIPELLGRPELTELRPEEAFLDLILLTLIFQITVRIYYLFFF